MRKLISDEGLYNVANTLDQLMNMDVPARGTIGVLYEAARKLQNGDPMTLAAIRLLQKTVKRGNYCSSPPAGPTSPAMWPPRARRTAPPALWPWPEPSA